MAFGLMAMVRELVVLVPWFKRLWLMWLFVGAVSLGVLLFMCFRIVNRSVLALEGSFWGFGDAFSFKKLPNP